MPPLSLIVTTLNEESSLPVFLASLEAQTQAPDEVVLCDGGSRDRTVSLLRQWSEMRNGVRVLEEEGASIARGRNCAIRAASMEWILVTDAGCQLDPHWVECMARAMENSEVSVLGGLYRIEGRSRFERWAAAAEIDPRRLPPDSFLPSSRSFAIRKSVWSEVGGYPEYLSFAAEDTALCMALRAQGHRILLVPDAIVTWYPRATLKAYGRQHRLYGAGDREAGIKGWSYGKIALKHTIVVLLIGLGFVWSLGWGLLALALLMYAFRLAPLYGWRQKPISEALAAFGLIFWKEASLLFGYLCARRRRRGREIAA